MAPNSWRCSRAMGGRCGVDDPILSALVADPASRKRLLLYSLMATIPWPRRRVMAHVLRCSEGRARSLVFPDERFRRCWITCGLFMNCHAGVLSSLHG